MQYPDYIDFDECTRSEAAAIGAMLLSRAALEYGLKKLRPKMLSSEWNRRVLLAMARLHKRKAIDQRVQEVTVIETSIELRKMGWPGDKAFDYCHACTTYCTSPDNYKFLVDDTVSVASKRSLCAVGEWLRLGEWAAFHARKPEADDKRVAAAIVNCVAAIERDGWCDPQKVWEQTK